MLRGDRQRIGHEVEADLKAAVTSHRLGLQILGVSLTDARPPAEVAADFAAAQSAESQRDRRTTEARTLAETTLTAARASARRGWKPPGPRRIAELMNSGPRPRRSWPCWPRPGESRELTVQRIYLDTMKSLLGKVRRKIVLPPGDAVDLTVLGIEE